MQDLTPDDLLAVVGGVAIEGLERLGALEVEVEIVLPGEADAAVDLDRVAADLAGRLAHVRLAGRRGPRRVVRAGGQRPRRVVDRGMRVLDLHQHLRAAMTDGLERADELAE